MLIWVVAVFCVSAFERVGAQIAEPTITLLSPQGIRFQIKHVPGATLAAFHYNVNNVLPNTMAGTWNFDVRSLTNDLWVHENRVLKLSPGDVVHYWIYLVVNGLGQHLTNKRWTVPGNVANPVNPVNPNVTPVVNPVINPAASAGDRPGLKLVFSDDFNTLDSNKWTTVVTLGGGGNQEFQAYTNLPETRFVRDGKLFIKPMPTADKYGGEAFINSGVWDVTKMYGYCTIPNFNGCSKDAKYGLLNPVLSARLDSKVTIRYGRVEIIAKMPRGDWLWPALWMLPREKKYGEWPRSGEIDICEVRGNRKFGDRGIEFMDTTLHWGTDSGNNRFMKTGKHTKAAVGTFADGMHNYTMDWDETGMMFYVDGKFIVRYATPNEGWFRWGNLPGVNIWPGKAAPFDQSFYLIINVAVGGKNGYFPDGIANEVYPKPWRNSDGDAARMFWNARSKWLPTWKGDDAAMQVESVRMWQKI